MRFVSVGTSESFERVILIPKDPKGRVVSRFRVNVFDHKKCLIRHNGKEWDVLLLFPHGSLTALAPVLACVQGHTDRSHTGTGSGYP